MLEKTEDLLSNLIGFDTTSVKSNRLCIDFIADYLDRCGIKSEIVTSHEGSKACLWATIGPEDKPGVVLAGHSDTVPVDGQSWTSDPFTLTEREGKLYGRGTCDMKGFIACALAIVPELTRRTLASPVHLAFTHDEETNMSGAENLTRFMAHRGIKPSWVWVGEPTTLGIINSHKGVAAYQTHITGVPGHSGQPAKGLNAIELGNSFMNILIEVARTKQSQPFVPSRFDPPYTTVNLGVIQGGTAENIIAEHCEILWQVRMHPGDNMTQMMQGIHQAVEREMAPRFKAFAPKAGIQTCTCFDIPPLMPTLDNPGEKLIGQFNGAPVPQAVSFATEGGFFQGLGTHVVICGPGSIDQAHKADEFVERKQLSGCIDLLQRVLLSSPSRESPAASFTRLG